MFDNDRFSSILALVLFAVLTYAMIHWIKMFSWNDEVRLSFLQVLCVVTVAVVWLLAGYIASCLNGDDGRYHLVCWFTVGLGYISLVMSTYRGLVTGYCEIPYLPVSGIILPL